MGDVVGRGCPSVVVRTGPAVSVLPRPDGSVVPAGRPDDGVERPDLRPRHSRASLRMAARLDDDGVRVRDLRRPDRLLDPEVLYGVVYLLHVHSPRRRGLAWTSGMPEDGGGA